MKEVQKTQTQEITKLIDLGDGQVITNLYLQGNDSQHETETSDPQIPVINTDPVEEKGSGQAGGQWETVYWDEGMVALFTNFILLAYLLRAKRANYVLGQANF